MSRSSTAWLAGEDIPSQGGEGVVSRSSSCSPRSPLWRGSASARPTSGRRRRSRRPPHTAAGRRGRRRRGRRHHARCRATRAAASHRAAARGRARHPARRIGASRRRRPAPRGADLRRRPVAVHGPDPRHSRPLPRESNVLRDRTPDRRTPEHLASDRRRGPRDRQSHLVARLAARAVRPRPSPPARTHERGNPQGDVARTPSSFDLPTR